MKILTRWRQTIQYKSLWRGRGESDLDPCLVRISSSWYFQFYRERTTRPQLCVPWSLLNRSNSRLRWVQSEGPRLWDVFQCKVSERSLDHYHDSPLTTPSETSSSFSPSERRDSNDSQDVGRNLPTGKVKRLGKDEKLARQEGITEYITVDDIINLPMGRFLESC